LKAVSPCAPALDVELAAEFWKISETLTKLEIDHTVATL